MPIRIRIKVNMQKFQRLKIEPWRELDAHNGGRFPYTLMRSRIRIRIKGWILVRIKVMWICNPAKGLSTILSFSRPSRDVTDQTLPGREYFWPGRVWMVTSQLGMGKTITFFLTVYS